MDAVTLPILRHYSQRDEDLSAIYSQIKNGKEAPEDLKTGKYKECFSEMSIHSEGILLRG